MELKYKIGVQRKIFESTLISNLNQAIPDDRTRDMAFLWNMQKLSKNTLFRLISQILLDTTILPEPGRYLMLDMDASFDFQVV